MDLQTQLIRDEGLVLKPYKDTLGNWTIGVGHLMSAEELQQFADGISYQQALDWLAADIAKVEDQLDPYSWYHGMDFVRQGAVCNMVFNLGISRFLQFSNTIEAFKEQNWVNASAYMLNSLWAKQVPNRAQRLAEQIKTGVWV